MRTTGASNALDLQRIILNALEALRDAKDPFQRTVLEEILERTRVELANFLSNKES